MLAVHNCLIIIFAATLHIGGHFSIHNLRTCHDMVIGTHLLWVVPSLHSVSYVPCLNYQLTSPTTEVENNRFLQKIGTCVPQCMVSDPRKP